MNTAIGNNTKAISDEVTRATGRENAIEAKVNGLLGTDGKVAHATLADTASGLDATGIAQVEGIKVDNAGHADSADDADKLDGHDSTYFATVESVTALNTNLTGAIATAKSEAISAAAEAAAETHYLKSEVYTKTEAENKFIDSNKLTGAINNIAITTTAGQGLVVTNNKHIDIDRSLTFIFNCGGASVEEA